MHIGERRSEGRTRSGFEPDQRLGGDGPPRFRFLPEDLPKSPNTPARSPEGGVPETIVEFAQEFGTRVRPSAHGLSQYEHTSMKIPRGRHDCAISLPECDCLVGLTREHMANVAAEFESSESGSPVSVVSQCVSRGVARARNVVHHPSPPRRGVQGSTRPLER